MWNCSAYRDFFLRVLTCSLALWRAPKPTSASFSDNCSRHSRREIVFVLMPSLQRRCFNSRRASPSSSWCTTFRCYVGQAEVQATNSFTLITHLQVGVARFQINILGTDVIIAGRVDASIHICGQCRDDCKTRLSRWGRNSTRLHSQISVNEHCINIITVALEFSGRTPDVKQSELPVGFQISRANRQLASPHHSAQLNNQQTPRWAVRDLGAQIRFGARDSGRPDVRADMCGAFGVRGIPRHLAHQYIHHRGPRL